MNFTILLGLAVAICLVGLFLRFFGWFSHDIDPSKTKISSGTRLVQALKGVTGVIFSGAIIKVLQSLFVDLIFQKKIIDKSLYRWITHLLILAGFLFLLFTHALGNVIFDYYTPTLNPLYALRDIAGLIVLVGIGLALYRRINLRPQRLKTNAGDWTALLFISIIMISGFMLEGAKISSYSEYQAMVEEYGEYDGEDALALEAYWVAEHGVRSPNLSKPIDRELVDTGLQLNEGGSCIECHSRASSAFVSFSLAGVIGPLSATLGDESVVSFLWYIHILACLSFLAWLPFSKMFHIVSAPVSLVINRVMGKSSDASANALNRQVIGLSACTHCGSCSVECSSMMFYESFQNDFILPSEKVQLLKKIAANKEVDENTLRSLQKGLYICTSCDRCTDICPSGINLRDLFVNARYYLLNRGKPETSILSHFSFPLSLSQNFHGDHLKALKVVHDLFKSKFKSLPDLLGPITLSRKKWMDNDTYRSCFSCQRCTNICPVVSSYDNPAEVLGMMPHQIIFSLGIGDVNMATGAQMIWSCSTCYLCQEHCPNDVELTDIFYRLKNVAINKIEAGENR